MFLGSIVKSETISQDVFLNRLIETHPIFEKEKITSQIEQKRRDSYLGSQDWNIQSSLFYSHDEPSFAVAGPEKTNAILINGGLKKAFWSTGGKLSASYSSTYINLTADPLLGLPGSYFENQFVVAYSHPLLRNKSGKLDRLQYNLSEFDINLSKVISKENEELFLANSIDKFLDWILLVEQHNIIVERLKLSEEELNRARDKRASNLIDEVDVIRAEDAVRVAKQNLLLVESQIKGLKSELAVLLQDDTINEMSPEFNLYDLEVLPTLKDAIAQLRENSRLLNTISIRIEQQKVLRTGYKEQLKSNLSLIVQAGLKSAETSYGSSLATDIPQVKIGFQLGFPFENRTAKANIAQTELQLMKLEKQSDEIEIELSSAVANLLTQATQLESVLELNQEQIESAKRKTDEELKLYNQGRGELTFVIQSRDSEQAAKLTYAINALTYHKLLLQFRELTDQLHN
jgi:outer membrane protein TolC